MPISTPKERLDRYDGDADHFDHVLDTLFVPAIEAAGLTPIPPKAAGSEIIHAEIIKNLASSELEKRWGSSLRLTYLKSISLLGKTK